jgi:gamma-glutamyltranspeptidase/glutathione hydrolase
MQIKNRIRTGMSIAILCAVAAACGRAAVPPDPAPPPPLAAELRVPAEWPVPIDRPEVKGERAMVATNEDLATRVGVEVLRRGGNAVDAAIAVAFALAVAHPLAGNLGGGGFAIVRTADGDTAALDFRETAPLGASREMFFETGESEAPSSWTGHLSVGVPGTVAGLWELHRRFGSRDWWELMEPAIRLAADGFIVPPQIRTTIEAVEKRLRKFPASAEIYLPDGAPPQPGNRWSNPDLATTLRRIAETGPDDFYRGHTADLIVAEMEKGGGLITRADLELYEAHWREPVEFDYRGHHVISIPPPSSGGLVIALIAAILGGDDLEAMGWHNPDALHLVAEAMRRAFAERNRYLGDPDFIDIPVDRFLSPDAAARHRRGLSTERATASADIDLVGGPGDDDGSTTHLSIVDPDGNAIGLTTTLNGWYGSAVTVAGAGFLLNNEMNDFATRPGQANRYGLIQGEANAIAPGKRMLSSMSPTIVLDPEGNLFMVTGAAGGSRIITAVFQILSNAIDFGRAAPAAVHLPRIHHQHLPDRIWFEPDGLPASLIVALEARGHSVEAFRGFIGVAPTLIRRDGVWTGTGEPHRREGGSARSFDPGDRP